MMIRTRQHGFTLIELLVVTVIVGVLLALVASTYKGVQAKNRNGDRQSEVNVLQSHLEEYYAQYSTYPTLANINDSNWRTANMKAFKADILSDPQWNNKTACTAHGNAQLSPTAQARCYSYQVSATDGSTCDNSATPCAQYTLTAHLEGGEKYVKSSLN